MKYMIVDIDGTIANCDHRLHYIQAPFWKNKEFRDHKSFYEACDKDEPINEVIDVVEKLMNGYKLVFCTGRPEYLRRKTMKWLETNIPRLNGVRYELLMRASGDHRDDTEVKPELVCGDNGIGPEDTAFIIEDRTRMVIKWRELGYTCFQVNEGDF